METVFNFKRPFLTGFIAVLFLAFSVELTAQENKAADLKDFKVIIEKTDDGIKIQSVAGSAWRNLSFSLNNYRPQAVDEYGMTELDEVSARVDDNLADFLFTITRTVNGIELKGIEGTAWTELKFSLDKTQKKAINQFGMTSLN